MEIWLLGGKFVFVFMARPMACSAACLEPILDAPLVSKHCTLAAIHAGATTAMCTSTTATRTSNSTTSTIAAATAV